MREGGREGERERERERERMSSLNAFECVALSLSSISGSGGASADSQPCCAGSIPEGGESGVGIERAASNY